MSITPPAIVVGAPRPPLPYGLLSVLAPREGSEDRWEGGGVTAEGLGCAPAPSEGLIGTWECEDTEGLPKTFDPNASYSDAQTFTVYQSEVCSPIGEGLERSARIAEGRLATFEELLVERSLWKVLEGLDSGIVIDSTGLDAVLDDLALAVARFEKLQGTIYGSQGVLHMSRSLALLGIKAKVLETRSNRLHTRLGTPVVAGSGYDEAETGDGGRIVWTPQLFGYRSPVLTSTNRQGDLLDRRNNNLYAVAERTWLVGFEECGDWAAAVTPDPTP